MAKSKRFSQPDAWTDTWVWVVAALYFLFYALASHFLYENLLFEDFDIAVHAQTMWNLVRGSGHCSILGVHFLANHFVVLFFPLKYVYMLYQSPLFLLYLQSTALALGGVAAYRVAKLYLDNRWAFAVALTYFFYPPLGYSNLFEFHPTTLAVPFLFMTIYYYLRQRLWLFLLWAVLAMSCQENISLAILMFGPLAFIEKRKAHWIVAPVAIAAVWFYVAVLKVMPHYNQGTIQFTAIYSHLGDSWGQIVLTLVTRPWTWIGSLLSPATWLFVIQLSAPLLFLPFLGWRLILPVIPFFFQHALSLRAPERTIYYHYTAEMIPFLVAGFAYGVAYVLEYFKEKFYRQLLLLALVISYAATFIVISPFSSSLDRMEKFVKDETLAFKKGLIAQIPPDAPAVATFQFLTQLAQRRELYAFHHVFQGKYTLSQKEFILPQAVQYALLDLSDVNTFGIKTEFSDKKMKEFFSRPWQVVDSLEDIVLLKKGRRFLDPLIRVNPTDKKPPRVPIGAAVNGEIALEGVTLSVGSKAPHEGHTLIEFHWKSLKKTTRNYSAALTLYGPRLGTFYEYYREIGYRILPTTQWEPGDVVVENYWFKVPENIPEGTGSLELRLGMLDLDKAEKQVFTSEEKGKVDVQGRVTLDTFELVNKDKEKEGKAR